MTKMHLPGSSLGVLGGGQLGRMFCVAARTMGYRTVVLDPDVDSPAGAVADEHICAGFDDEEALRRFAARSDVITTEFENVPADSLQMLSETVAVHPSANVLRIAQDRALEKSFALEAGLCPVPHEVVTDESHLEQAAAAVGFPAILKSTRLGYDGKGQAIVASIDELRDAFRSIGGVESVLERKIALDREISVIVCRNPQGDIASWPVGENEHRNGILHATVVPASVDERLMQTASDQARSLAEKLGMVGVLAVEFFISVQGDLYFNEMAPRPHNSGHYTEDACVTSQYEQLVRMICALSPGDTRLLTPVVMVNLLGDLWPVDWEKLTVDSGTKLHLYGKKQARPGRKMGHYNVLDADIETAKQTAAELFETISR